MTWKTCLDDFSKFSVFCSSLYLPAKAVLLLDPFVLVKQSWVYSPSVFTVTTSLKGPVPSLFWARTLNWYVVSGSKPGTTIQSWPPGTGMESQSYGPKRSLFSLHRSHDEMQVHRQEKCWRNKSGGERTFFFNLLDKMNIDLQQLQLYSSLFSAPVSSHSV